LSFCLIGRQGANREGVDARPHHLTKRAINNSMASHRILSFEAVGDDRQPVMPAASPCSGVSGMERTFVLDFEGLGKKREEALADILDSRHGSTFL
jgi:hypothetical protein